MEKSTLKYSILHALFGGIISFYLAAYFIYFIKYFNITEKIGIDTDILDVLMLFVMMIIFLIFAHISSSTISKKLSNNGKDVLGLSSIIFAVFLLIINFLQNGDYITIGIYLLIFFLISRSNFKYNK